ncbi:MFS transporter [Massilia sp. RP-1-19]|uniref:MFS transporter n=1 Tax=Massilia polaris TaxID=2728846 RepID=A0A848HLT6_9BURK|nr:MFS transporter [Massilia polaris]NML62866.1 MFS transporter [Massilia polaris]
MNTDSPRVKRINRAILFGGFSVFALLYCVQPLMPLMAQQFALSAAESSWVLSISTLTMAVTLVLGGALSDRIGRKALMTASMVGGAACTLLCAFAQDFTQLLILRALLGVALGGMPAVAMAYLGEEIAPQSLGVSIGMYIGGSALGGMLARVITSVVADYASWRFALFGLGVAGLYAGWEFWRSLPESNNFRPGRPGVKALLDGARLHLRDDGLPWLFALGFLLMGVFVSLYNYIGYRLLAAPFSLGQTAVGLLSVLYVTGMYSSVWAGRLADRIGRRNVLWMTMALTMTGLALTLSANLIVLVTGMCAATFGFFASHSVASSWVGMRARAPKALASALYLFFYYVGGSMVGWLGGLAWGIGAWNAVVSVLLALLGIAMLIALRLRGLAPLAPAPVLTSAGTGVRTAG